LKTYEAVVPVDGQLSKSMMMNMMKDISHCEKSFMMFFFVIKNQKIVRGFCVSEGVVVNMKVTDSRKTTQQNNNTIIISIQSQQWNK